VGLLILSNAFLGVDYLIVSVAQTAEKNRPIALARAGHEGYNGRA
jgi:hypothetical protein